MLASRRRLHDTIAIIAFSTALLGGCAMGTNPRDPFEPLNRGVYQFNEALDKAVMKPVATAYRTVLPQFVRTSVSNFFSNLNDVAVAVNNLLQGKFTAAYSDLGRIAINTTLGLGGLFDVASEAGIEKHEEDLGQTLGRWGFEDGPFVMLPFFGPSNVRDVVGRVGDIFVDPVTYVDRVKYRNILWGTRVVNRRAELLDASTVLETAALDPYEFVRDAYLQRRRNLIYDGAPPPDREFLDAPQRSTPDKSGASGSVFPSSAESASSGSTLVSGDAGAPVRSASDALAREARVAAGADQDARSAAVLPPPPAWYTRDDLGWSSGEPLTPAELDALEQPTQPRSASAPPGSRPLPAVLVRIWRTLAQ